MSIDQDGGSRPSHLWKPGQSGNPKGGPRRRIIRDKLNEAVHEVYENISGLDEKGQALELIAKRAVRIALLGNDRVSLQAIQWITEQLDGKVPQAITAEAHSAGITFNFVEAKPKEGE